jgi:hypothetical protein
MTAALLVSQHAPWVVRTARVDSAHVSPQRSEDVERLRVLGLVAPIVPPARDPLAEMALWSPRRDLRLAERIM